MDAGHAAVIVVSTCAITLAVVVTAILMVR